MGEAVRRNPRSRGRERVAGSSRPVAREAGDVSRRIRFVVFPTGDGPRRRRASGLRPPGALPILDRKPRERTSVARITDPRCTLCFDGETRSRGPFPVRERQACRGDGRTGSRDHRPVPRNTRKAAFVNGSTVKTRQVRSRGREADRKDGGGKHPAYGVRWRSGWPRIAVTAHESSEVRTGPLRTAGIRPIHKLFILTR
jgi:hypothetical protein